MRIYIFGDSITEGFYDEEKGGWVNRLKTHFLDDEIYNFGISGDTTKDLLERFDQDIKGKNPDMIIFAIGINDSIYLPAKNGNYVNFDKFKKNIAALISKAKILTDKIVFIGLTPVDESMTSPIPWEMEMYYTNEEIAKYNIAIAQICKNENLKFINIFTDFKSENYAAMLSDGLHPNKIGHEWLSNKIMQELKYFHKWIYGSR